MKENPYQKYKEEAVMTMTQGEMLLLLYDELLKRLRAAELLAQKEDYENYEAQLVRASDIIRYLRATLDFQYPISRELNQMYDFFMVELSRIKVSRKADQIEGLKSLVTELRDAFGEAEKKVAQ